MKPRLNPSARRDVIVTAAIPLFARKGFAGTTTREIAEAAGVSEALVFKHFATKTELYDAIFRHFQHNNHIFEGLQGLPPSTRTLVHVVRVTTSHFTKWSDDNDAAKSRYRMVLRSLSEDGVFAGIAIEAYAAELRLMLEQSFEAARRTGDLYESAPDATTAFWSVARQHFMLVAWTLLPARMVTEIHTEDTVRSILRGIGLKESVVTATMADHLGGATGLALTRSTPLLQGERIAR